MLLEFRGDFRRIMEQTRKPAVAGLFYPERPAELQSVIATHLDVGCDDARRPLALIVPHAGLVYSGPVAGSAYRRLLPHRDAIRRVVLIGPAHRVALAGIAAPSADAFATPLGKVRVDRERSLELLQLPGVIESDEAHQWEHCLEVQLPFLQTVLADFSIVPLVAGRVSAEIVGTVLKRGWDDQSSTLLLISSDLSHYLSYDEAQRVDRATADAVLRRRQDLAGDQACGCYAINGLMHLAEQAGWRVELLDLRNSGDTAGPRDRVVGYGSFALYDA